MGFVLLLLISFFCIEIFCMYIVTHRLARQKAAVCHLKHCSETYQLRIILKEWNIVVQEARRTRDYFDRIERGEENQQLNNFLSKF